MDDEREAPVPVLRPATPADRDLLDTWDATPHVRAAFGDDELYDWDVELHRPDPHTRNRIAECDGRPVAFVQIVDAFREATQYFGDVDDGTVGVDIWIGDPVDLGRGLGTRIMHHVLDTVFSDADVRCVLVDPIATNTAAQRFYARFGFVPTATRTFERSLTVVMRLDRDRWSRERRSPPSPTTA